MNFKEIHVLFTYDLLQFIFLVEYYKTLNIAITILGTIFFKYGIYF